MLEGSAPLDRIGGLGGLSLGGLGGFGCLSFGGLGGLGRFSLGGLLGCLGGPSRLRGRRSGGIVVVIVSAANGYEGSSASANGRTSRKDSPA